MRTLTECDYAAAVLTMRCKQIVLVVAVTLFCNSYLLADNQEVSPSTQSASPSTQPTAGAGRLVLSRIVAEGGQPIDNKPTFILSSVSASELPKQFSVEIDGMINWPNDYQPAVYVPYTDSDKERIVADGLFYVSGGAQFQGGGFRCIGKFVVDKNLTPSEGIWDGMKEGAVHELHGKLTIQDYAFESDQEAPLKFKVTKDGYLYFGGKGQVRDIKTGEIYKLGQ
jgi:hypothetical protein